MNNQELLKTLSTLTYLIRGKNFSWRLEGSANLKIQGLDVPVNDLDIATNADGLRIFKKCLEQYKPQEIYHEQKKIRSIHCTIKTVQVEIHCYDHHELRLLEKAKPQQWNNLSIFLLPLPYALTFYEKIRRLDKVELIQNYLKENRYDPQPK